eukprot:m51a1_g12292 putative peroxisome biogenesis protein 5-like (694) ;mRNA; f:310884-313092
MQAIRELVGARECGAPTALSAFARLADVAQQPHLLPSQQEVWERAAPGPLDHLAAPPPPPEYVTDVLRGFFESAHTGRPLPQVDPAAPPFALAPQDQAKLMQRAAVLARHAFAEAPAQFAGAQLDSLARLMHVGAPAQAAAVPLGPDDAAQWDVGAHARDFEGAWAGESWASEFAGPHGPAAAAAAASRQHELWAAEMAAQQHAAELDAAWAASHPQAQAREEEARLEAAWTEAHAQTASAGAAAADADAAAVQGRELRATAQKIADIQDPQLRATEFMKFMRKVASGEVELRGSDFVQQQQQQQGGEWAAEFAGQQREAPGAPASAWATEYADALGAPGQREQDEADVWADEYHAGTAGRQDAAALAAAAGPGSYVFSAAASNPYFGNPHAMQRGKALYEEGHAAEAVLALEAEVQQNPGNAEAWRMLGVAQADGDNDEQAVAALERARAADPGDLTTELALAVSLANDLHKDRAIEAARSWLARNPRYAAMSAACAEEHARARQRAREELAATTAADEPEEEFRGLIDQYERHSEALAAFAQAAQSAEGASDADVQVGLGLMFTLSYDYDSAVECFKNALQARPRDHLLWNKLGATLANANRHAEAIGAYERALALRPAYVRARSNLGISLVAVQKLGAASVEFLRALELDSSAEHVWENLALSLRMSGREDLAKMVSLRNVDFFRDHFDF